MVEAKRRKTGGRKPGTPNKRSGELLETLKRLNCNPAEGMALIANGDYTCTVCLGRKKLKLSKDAEGKWRFDPEGRLLDCLNCMGTGKEPIPVALRLKAMSELQTYVFPKRRAIDFSRSEGHGDFTLAELLATMRGVVDGS